MPYEIKYTVEYYFVDDDGNPVEPEMVRRLFIDALDGRITVEACERREDDA